MYDSKYIGKILQWADPQALAMILGSTEYKNLNGKVCFYDIGSAILVTTSLYGIPSKNGYCQHPVLGLHIHEGAACSGNDEDPFADAKGHYNPHGCEHPEHAGDLPPVFVNEGIAWSAVITTRFTIKEITGRTVIVHAMPDDFHSQPSGDSGKKIACGIIQKITPVQFLY
ncbi:MAG: superoxide dismutase family protein [Roseburia sp.]|nr:superoxide dismutase family protein [Roseburia sp.]